jgi:uncharacterized protein YkwD
MAILYQHGDFSGWKAYYPSGVYDYKKFIAAGAVNDDVSAIKVVLRVAPSNPINELRKRMNANFTKLQKELDATRKQFGSKAGTLNDLLRRILAKLNGTMPAPPAPPVATPAPTSAPTPAPPVADKPPTATSPPATTAPPGSSDPDAAVWLSQHNYFRCIHNTPEISWDEDVAAGSATWAQKGQMKHAKCYSIPAPRGPSGENLAAGQSDIAGAVTAWYDESPEKGPECGGHCTALLWKKSTALGCSRKNTWNGNRPMYVCRYAKTAANFGSMSEGVNMPDYTKEEACYKKYNPPRRWTAGASSAGTQHDGKVE